MRYQGESIIDLTWATPTASRKFMDWRVAQELETLSDHRTIMMEVDLVPPAVIKSIRQQQDQRPKWAVRKLDEDKLKAAMHLATWSEEWGSV